MLYSDVIGGWRIDAATLKAVDLVVKTLDDLRQKETAHLVGRIKQACGVPETETAVEAEKVKAKKPKKATPENESEKAKGDGDVRPAKEKNQKKTVSEDETEKEKKKAVRFAALMEDVAALDRRVVTLETAAAAGLL